MNYDDRPTVLLVDDDDDDVELVEEALRRSAPDVRLRTLRDGEELMDYLTGGGRFAALADRPRPGLILLDLNMPRLDGREALRAIKSDPSLRGIPIVVLTVSSGGGDIQDSYDLGVAGYVTKPTTMHGLTEVVATLADYWLRTVRLPKEGAA
jgi:two-component system response regulator